MRADSARTVRLKEIIASHGWLTPALVGKDGMGDPIEDISSLDARRAAIGLPTMSVYVRQLAEAYKTPVEWPPKPPQ
jgi:hypothetical protein